MLKQGNELCGGGINKEKVFPTPTSYAVMSQNLTLQLKRLFPGVKVSINGCDPNTFADTPPCGDYCHSWNRLVLPHVPAADAVTLHWYFGAPHIDAGHTPTTTDAKNVFGVIDFQWQKFHAMMEAESSWFSKLELWVRRHDIAGI